MKQAKPRAKEVCMICGKPSKESICEPCKSKIQAENLERKRESEKKT